MRVPKDLTPWVELARRKRDEQIRYFLPHGGQQEFINLVADPGGFIVITGAGNGWGKSELIVAIVAATMWPNLAPAAFAHPTFQSWKHPKVARLSSTPKELSEMGSLQAAIKKYFPKGRYSARNLGKTFPCEFKTDTGWVLDLFSYEQDVSEYAGPNIGLQVFNEPPPEAIWKEAVARTRSGGMILGGMTSLLENPWVVSGIFDKADGDRIRVRYGDVEENCKEHGTNGRLEHSRIEQILAEYDPDEREARKTGKPLSLSGAIFKTFDRNVHVAKEPLIPPQGSTIYQVVDPAIGKPLASIWAYVDASGKLAIYDEHPEGEFQGMKDSGLTVLEYARLFKAREAGKDVAHRILDRHFGNVRRTLGGKTLKQEFAELPLDARLIFQDSYMLEEEVETGILKVKDFLRYDKSKPIDSLNQPRLIVSPTCRNTIHALQRWARNPKTGKPQEEFKDFSDVVRYLVMANPGVMVRKDWSRHKAAHYGVGNV